MKRKKILSVMLAAAIVSANLCTTPVFAAETASNLGLDLTNVKADESTNAINGTFNVTNNGEEAINLSDVKIRYYFTADNKKGQEFHCYNADIADPYKSVTGNVTGKFVKMESKADGADTYLEIGFDSSAGTLDSGKTVNIDSSFNKKDWSSFNQSNDYSFNDAQKVVVLVGGNVVSGTEPTVSTVDPSKATTTGAAVNVSGKVEVNVSNGSSANSIAPTFTITNTGDEELDLTTLKLKYFYTADGDEAETFNCYYAGTVGGDYQNLTGNVEGKIVKLGSAVANADSYIQVGFNGGTLEAGQSAQVQASVNKDGWKEYNQSDDYSYGDSKHVAAYVDNKLIWGSEPDGTPIVISAKLDRTNISVDKASLKDETINITLNGNTFTGISGLTEGTDYTVSDGNIVTINSSYFGNLPVGSKALTFNFDKGDAQKLNVNVTDSSVTPDVDPIISPVSGDYNKSNKADINVQMTLNGKSFVDIKNKDAVLSQGTDYVVNGDVVTIKESYLDTLAEGQATDLTFDFSEGKSKVFTVNVIKAVEDGLVINIPDVTTKAGATVTIPVTITGIDPTEGLNGCNFKLKYDPALFENVSITSGDICVNPAKTLFKTIDSTSGTMSIMYADSTGKDLEAIVKNGVFMNINLKVKDSAANATSQIQVTKAGKFVDKDSHVYTINYKVGKITIGDGGEIVTPVQDSTLDTNSANVVSTTSAGVQVGMVLNGNKFVQIQNGDKVLVQGTDYTVDGTNVTINPSYISTLPEGSNGLTFKFSAGNDAKFTLNVTKPATETFAAGIGKIEAKAGDTVTIPVTLSQAPTAGIANFSYRIKYDPSLVEVVGVDAGSIITNPEQNFVSGVYEDTKTISILFIDNALSDEETIKNAGVLSNIKLKIKDNAPKGLIPIEFNNDDHSFYDINGNEIKADFNNGSIEVK